MTSKKIIDLNEEMENSIVYFNPSTLHKPPFMEYGTVYISKREKDRISNIAISIYDKDGIAIRSKSSNGWSEWKKLATENTLENKFNLTIETSEIHNYKKCIEDNWSTFQTGNSQCLVKAGSQGSAIIYKLNNDYGSVIIHGYNNYGEILIGYISSGTWAWEQVVTSQKTEIPFPFDNGYTTANYRDSKVYKDSLGMVTITCGFSKTSGNLDTGTDVLIGTLPVGYRPMNGTQRINVSCPCWGGTTPGTGYVYIDIDGKVRYSTLGNVASVMFIQCSFLSTL